ncbi:MAG TPA: hypothetical protein VFS08_13395 [Gemmatimonadaceae bacterium]|nr:hypothetical protein [Gemmatimonadaceae bacterium]
MMPRHLVTLVLLAACAGDGARDRADEHAGDAPPPAAAGAEFEARLLHGTVERGAFVGASHLLVQLEDDGAYLYRRADGERVALDVHVPDNRWRPHVTWSAPLSSDRVAVFDLYNHRLVEFDTAGTVVRATSLASPSAFPAPVAAFADGGLLVLRDFLPSPYVQETGAYADTTALLPVTAELDARGPEIPVTRAQRYGALADPQPGDEVRTARTVGAVRRGVFDGRQRYSLEVPLSPRMQVAGTRDGVYLGAGDAAEIRVLAPDGTERERFRILEEGRPVDPAMRARVREDRMRNAMEPQFRELYERVAIPDRTPRYRRLLADAEGRLWVERYPLPGDAETVWTVYRRDGARVGSVTLPEGVQLLDATGQRLLLARPGVLGSTRLQVVPYTLH